MQRKPIEVHRRVKTALQSLSPRTAKKVENSIDLIAKYADNRAQFPGTMVKFLGKELPNTYMIEATPTLRVVFQLTESKYILIQDILHRDWFTVFSKGSKKNCALNAWPD